MNTTLYQELKAIEEIDTQISQLCKISDKYSKKGISQNYEETMLQTKTTIKDIQKRIMLDYERNPIFNNSIMKKQTIENKLIDASQINKGIKKFLPRRINKEHNKEIDYLGELITKPSQLQTKGLILPDNIISGIGFSAVCYGAIYLILSQTTTLLDPIPAYLSESSILHSKKMLAATFTMFAPVFGMGANTQRFRPLAIEEAKYLDEKIEELYQINN